MPNCCNLSKESNEDIRIPSSQSFEVDIAMIERGNGHCRHVHEEKSGGHVHSEI